MKKKLIATLMVLAMGMNLVGCSSSGKDASLNSGGQESSNITSAEGASKISEKLIEVEFFMPTQGDGYTGEEDIFKTIQHYTNIKFKPIAVPLSSYSEKLSTTIASGKLPDLMSINGQSTVDQYGPQGAFVSLDKYIEEGMMPNYEKILKEYEPAEALVRSSDGKLYGAPRMYAVDYRVDQMWLARTDILEKHGLTRTPETFEELYDVMKQLKEIYPDSTPYINRWGVGHLIGGQTHFRNTSSTYFLNEDTKQYEYGPASQAYKDSLEFLATAYKDGILNPDFATLTDPEVDELLMTGKGFFTFDYPHWADEIERAVGKENLPEGFEWQPILQPSYNGVKRGTPVLSGYFPTLKVIAAGTKYEEELVRFLDWTYSEEGAKARMYGIEGETYEMDGEDNVKFLKDYKTPATPDGTITNHGFNDQYIFGMLDPLALNVYEMGATNLNKATQFMAENGGLGEPTYGAKFFDESERKRYNDIMTPINTYVEEASMKVILGQASLDNWDTEVMPVVESMGLEEAGQLINKAYKETFGEQ